MFTEPVQVNCAYLGGSGAGKTCLLALTAALYSRHGKPVVTYRFAAEDTASAMHLEQVADQLMTEEGEERRPEGTRVASEFVLTLLANGNKVARMQIDDYHGAGLQRDQRLTELLATRAANADLLVLALPAGAILKASQDNTDTDAWQLLRRKLRLTQHDHFIDKLAERARELNTRLPVVILITQFDLLYKATATDWDPCYLGHRLTKDEINRRALALYDPALTSNKDAFSVAIVPVSLGLGLGENFANAKAEIRPLNLHRAFGGGGFEAMRRRQSLAETQLAQLKTLRAQRQRDLEAFTGWRRLFDTVFQDGRRQSGLRGSVTEAGASVDRAEAELQRVISELKLLIPLVQGLRYNEGDVQYRIDGDGYRRRLVDATHDAAAA